MFASSAEIPHFSLLNTENAPSHLDEIQFSISKEELKIICIISNNYYTPALKNTHIMHSYIFLYSRSIVLVCQIDLSFLPPFLVQQLSGPKSDIPMHSCPSLAAEKLQFDFFALHLPHQYSSVSLH